MYTFKKSHTTWILTSFVSQTSKKLAKNKTKQEHKKDIQKRAEALGGVPKGKVDGMNWTQKN